jgi:trehalose 6-phosphate synthase
MGRLIVISNRVTMPTEPGAPAVGGLAMALAAALQQDRGIWFGWSGQTTTEFTGQLSMSRVSGVTVATVDLEEQDVQEYYNGFANETLWPICHYRLDLAMFERSFDQGYQRVNARFAETVRPLIDPDDLIWVHDYHLIPMARELRRLGVTNRIGFFLHIPWPARELVTALPRHRQLVEALFDYDVIGFQTTDWLRAFHNYLAHEVDGEVLGNGRVRAFGRTISAGAFPIGIDAKPFQEISASAAAEASRERMLASLGDRALIVGVDRLDYSKGLEERFHAYEQFLTDNPDWQERVQLLQIAPPSREAVDAYQNIRAGLDSLTGRINGNFATVDWTPVQYVNRAYARDELAGIYSAAKVGLVTPMRDGMNLVAKEYVAAQRPDDPGVLILSRFAGAALQMKDALIVNPYSREDVSEAIKRALAMPLNERKRRWQSLVDGVQSEDVEAWRDSFVAALQRAREPGVICSSAA